MTITVNDAQYRFVKKYFDDNPLAPSIRFHTDEGWEIYHYIKIYMIKRTDIDVWEPANQFELAIILQNYHIDHIPEMNKWEFPVRVEFFDELSRVNHGKCHFDYKITGTPII